MEVILERLLVEVLAIAVQLALWRLLEWVGCGDPCQGRRAFDDRLTTSTGRPARRTPAREPSQAAARGCSGPRRVIGGALDRLSPGRRRRRSWVGDGKAHIEVRGVNDPKRKILARDVERALHAVEGVEWAQVNAVAGRVVVAFDPDGPSPEDLIEVIERVEEVHEVHKERFSHERPEHPGDIEPVRRQAIAIGADVVALGSGLFGQLLRVTPIPAELGSLVALAENEPRFRHFLEQHLGVALTDLGLGITSAFVQSLSQGPLTLATDITHRANRLGELQAMRRAWERREADLCNTPHDDPSAQ